MAKFRFRLPKALKPKFCWWSNEWDIRSLISAIVIVSFFLPILPWEGRKQGNYSLTANLHGMAEAASREVLDVDALKDRYEKQIPDEDLRSCIVARNVLLTLVADTAIMYGDMNSTKMSKVPIVFLFDSVINSIMDAIAVPDFDSVLVEVAEKCQDFPNEYLTVEDVEVLKRKELPRMSFWEYLQ